MFKFFKLICLAGALWSAAAAAEGVNPLLPDSAKLIAQREAYSAAKDAIKSGDPAYARSLQQGILKGYPLNIWLDYYYLSTNLSIEKFKAAKLFIGQQKQRELGSILKRRYISYLANHGYYKAASSLLTRKPYADEDKLRPGEQGLQCRFYEIQWRLGRGQSQAVAFGLNLYLSLRSVPDECGGLMALMSARGYLSDKIKLEKFERAYVSSRYENTTRALARALAGSKFSSQIQTQMSYYDNPGSILDYAGTDNRSVALIFTRYANLNPQQAAAALTSSAVSRQFSAPQLLQIKQTLALNLLGRMQPKSSVDWVDANLPAIGWTQEIKELRLRRAIWYAQWRYVYDLIDNLDDNADTAVNWRYWKGRAALALGREDEGEALLEQAASDRSFWGFLAADRLDQRLPFNHQRRDFTLKWPDALVHNQSAIRYFELLAVGDPNASVEWREAAKTSSDDEAMLLAEWALRTGKINLAIDSVVSAKRWDALDYRFPIAYLDIYKHNASSQGVPLSFLYGITRQESMMNASIRSHAGAVGLMQLMPGTARMVSRQNDWSYGGVSDLIVPEHNVRLGTAYLRNLLDKFDQNRVLAAGGYNAGPGRIVRWKSNDGMKRDAAMFIENIPFNETRQYVQNVLLYASIYEKLLSRTEVPVLTETEKQQNY